MGVDFTFCHSPHLKHLISQPIILAWFTHDNNSNRLISSSSFRVIKLFHHICKLGQVSYIGQHTYFHQCYSLYYLGVGSGPTINDADWTICLSEIVERQNYGLKILKCLAMDHSLCYKIGETQGFLTSLLISLKFDIARKFQMILKALIGKIACNFFNYCQVLQVVPENSYDH
jgi:hypothetical protein